MMAPPPEKRFVICGKACGLYILILIFLGWQFCRMAQNWETGAVSLFYFIHAPAHEAGHALAGILHLPRLWVVASGSIFQELAPVAVAVYWFGRRDYPAISVCLSWLGLATMEMAAYMADASARVLTLVVPFGVADEDSHDFANLFQAWGCMKHARQIGEIFAWAGGILVIAGMLMIIWMLVRGALHPETRECSTGSPPPRFPR